MPIPAVQTITEISITNTALVYNVVVNNGALPNTLSSMVTTTPGQQEDEQFLEGELIIRMINNPAHINWTIDEDTGELVLLTDLGDASNYSLDATNGNLIYTTNS